MKIKSNHYISWIIGFIGIIPMFVWFTPMTVLWAIIWISVSRELWGNNLFN
jgi:hypothetical protein